MTTGTAGLSPRPAINVGVGMPALLHLEWFGSLVWDAFGHPPYLVGSALVGKSWRDVDVRLILDDEEYDGLFGAMPAIERMSGKWCALCAAFSALGRDVTGLPIDFQIQKQSQANERFSGAPRQALGLLGVRIRE
jgi:hypothetical protein